MAATEQNRSETNAAPAPEQPVAESAPLAEPKPQRKRDPVRRITLIFLAIAMVIYGYTLIADRFTPYSSQARVQAYLVRIMPQVSGNVVEIGVGTNERVEAGTLLFRIDPSEFEIAVEQATAQLEAAGQSVGASTAGIVASQANVARAMAELTNVREQTARIFQLVEKGIYAQARADQATAALNTAEAAVRQAEAELEEARAALGPQGASNPEIREAAARLQTAELNLARTRIVAPSDGAVTALQLTLGQYVNPQVAAMTYIDTREIWIDVQFRENSLEHVEPGDEVAVIFDILPGRVFRAHVASVGFGVSSGKTDAQTGLPVVDQQIGWLRDPQSLPIRIEFAPDERPRILRFGSQASVMVFAGDNAALNGLGRLWMWVESKLTYLR